MAFFRLKCGKVGQLNAMSRLSFDSAETLIYDPVAANRTATRAALYNLGFRRIESVATLDAFEDQIRRRPPDLALCEAQGADAELCSLIQMLRQGANGTYNPFLVIMVTAWEKTNALVSRVVNSGADDLILRPFSTTVLGQRIETHIERRKSFVITTDYVGPDRRRDTSRASNVDLFDPPNSLKLKAKYRLSADEVATRLENELKVARDLLHSEKLRRDAFQICILWRLAQEQPAASPDVSAYLTKLTNLTRAVRDRTNDLSMLEAMEWCEQILAAIEALQIGIDRNPSMHLLGHASLSLIQTLAPEKSTADYLAQVDATVAIIRARAQAPAAQPAKPAAVAAAQ